MPLSSGGILSVNAVGVVLVAILTIVPLLRVAAQSKFSLKNRRISPNEKLYQDRDGIASEESESQFSSRIPCFVLYISTLSGSCMSLASAVLSATHDSQYLGPTAVPWIQFATWVLIAIQSLYIFFEKRCVARHNQAVHSAVCHFVLFVLMATNGIELLYQAVDDDASSSQRSPQQLVGLMSATFAMVIAGFFAALLVPRRPQVFREGKIVEQQWTVSTFSRMTYSWCSYLLQLASKKGELTMDDLPVMDHYTRAEDLHDAFVSSGCKGSLLRQLLYSHRSGLIRQNVVTTVSSILEIAPKIAMYQLLKVLEERDNGAGQHAAVSAALWVVALGLTLLIMEWLDNWKWWISNGQVQVPLRAQLSALIFSKSLRRKDVRGASKKETPEKPSPEAEQTDTSSTKSANSSKSGENEDEPETEQKTRQATINLVGVDADRIAMFSTFSNLLLGSVVKLIVVFIFLGKLMGAPAIFAGIAAQALILPLNTWATKGYMLYQRQVMEARDQKLAVLNEALGGIRQIKFSALESQWIAKIRAVREKELSYIWKTRLYDTLLIWLWVLSPALLSAISLAVYAALNGSLQPSVAFTAIATLTSVEGTLSIVPEVITVAIDALVSVKRIEKYLNSPEKIKNTEPGDTIAFENATIAWPSDEEVDKDAFKLHDMNVSFPKGELSVISGRTGSGKSLILLSILGEAEVLSGKVIVPDPPKPEDRHDHLANKSNWIIPSATAFVSQQPWIENATFKDNILFGLPFDADRYKKVVSACALEKDLEMLIDGEQTEIGANGVNLSGGQKWRITMARALYSRSGILILDDVLSAVDAHVGRHLFTHALTGELAQGRTRILVSHHVSLLLPKTKFQVQLGDGGVESAGFVSDLQQTGQLEHILEEEAKDGEQAIEDDEAGLLPDIQHVRSHSSNRGGRTTSRRRNSRLSQSSRTRSVADERSQSRKPRKYTEDEAKEQGKVKWKVYSKYLNAAGGVWFWIVAVFLFCLHQAVTVGRNYWVAVWTDTERNSSKPIHAASGFYHSAVLQTVLRQGNNKSDDLWSLSASDRYLTTAPSTDAGSHSLSFYLWIYVGFGAAVLVEGAWRYFWIYLGGLRASRRLFEELMEAVLRAPLRWLDTVPQGRILNRFTADFNSVDLDLGTCVGFLLYNVIMLLGIIVAGILVSPYIVIVSLVLLAICTNYALYFLNGAREAKRLESIAKSPIFDLFGITLSGIVTIRAFDKAMEYQRQMFTRINNSTTGFWYRWVFNRWLGIRLGLVGSAFGTIMAILVVSLPQINASLGGFALGFVLQYNEACIWILRNYSMVELAMNAMERVMEYSSIKTENSGGEDAPAAWPTEGRLEVEKLEVAYASDLPPVLKGLSFQVNRNERIGVVGRTGAGKSSLTLALFRFLEARSGTIHIDGIDVSKITLHDLRSRLAIIPQDPVLFSGTVRSNLDPFNDHNDVELIEALERVHLRTSQNETNTDSAYSSAIMPSNANINVFDDLSSPVSEGGSNLSQGQRQLLCLARAIVARPKIMVLDEATSAVDKTTDGLIQRSIREEFSDSTLIVIAHRLSTIADFDRILVMSDGKVEEYDTPAQLMENGNGAFKGMVEDSGEKEVLNQIIFGNGEGGS